MPSLERWPEKVNGLGLKGSFWADSVGRLFCFTRKLVKTGEEVDFGSWFLPTFLGLMESLGEKDGEVEGEEFFLLSAGLTISGDDEVDSDFWGVERF